MQQSQVDIDDLSAEAPRGGLNFGPYIRMIKRNILLIASSTLLLGTLGFIKNQSSPPLYLAGFRLLVEPVTAEARLTDPLVLTRNQGVVRDQNLDYATQLELLKSPAVLERIYEQVKEEFPDFAFIQLVNDLTVERSEQTKILEVTFFAGDPDLVQAVLDATVDRYLQYSLEERRTRISEGVRFIEDQLPDLRSRASELQGQLEQLQNRFFIGTPEVEGAQLSNQLREVTTQQAETQRLLREQQSFYASLQEQLNLSPNQAIAASALSEDPGYQSLIAQYREIEAQIAIELARFTEESPAVRALRDRQNNLLGLMDVTAQEIVGPSLQGEALDPQVRAFQNSIRKTLINQMVEANNQIQILQVRLTELAQLRASLESRIQDFPAIARDYSEIQRDLDITNQALDQLLSQRETLRLEAAQSEVPWELLSAPQVPIDEQGNPMPEGSKPVILLAGIMGGALLGAGLAFALEMLRDIFYDVEDVSDAVPATVLGVIPPCPFAHQVLFFSPETSTLRPSDHASIVAFQEAFSELFAGLRFQYTENLHSFAVCGAMEKDGSSTIAANLAQTLAAAGKQVLLVDTNFRNPALHDLFRLSNQKGLCDVLKADLEPEFVIQRSPTSANLSVLTTGIPTVDAPKMLGSAQMEALSDRFAKMFDVVIYDAPPLRDYMDTIFLSDHVDGLLLSVSLRQTKQSAVKESLEKLKEYSVTLVGSVVNQPTHRQRSLKQDENVSVEQQPLWMQTGVSSASSKANESSALPLES